MWTGVSHEDGFECEIIHEPRVETGAFSGTLPVVKNMEHIFVNKKQTVSTSV